MIAQDTIYQGIDLLSRSIFNYAESNRLGIDSDTCKICGFNRIRLGSSLVCGSYCDSTAMKYNLYETQVKWKNIKTPNQFRVKEVESLSWITLEIHQVKLEIRKVKRAPKLFRSERRAKLLILADALYKLELMEKEESECL